MKIDFVKYSVNGNSFILIDSVKNNLPINYITPQLAFKFTNVDFGIGADNLILIDKYVIEKVSRINSGKSYWTKLNFIPECLPQYIFRMFEPDGSEAINCGNGLISVAHYLRESYNIINTHVLVGVSTKKPWSVEIGLENDRYYTEIGILEMPVLLTGKMLELSRISPKISNIRLSIPQRSHKIPEYSELDIIAFVVFSGEPHIVILEEDQESNIVKEIFTKIFIKDSSISDIMIDYKRKGSRLIEAIGGGINSLGEDYFPKGINVNFVRRDFNGRIRVRTYERGIFKETYSCGTGAVAISSILHTVKEEGVKHRFLNEKYYQYCNKFTGSRTILFKSDVWRYSSLPSKIFEGNIEK